jgi:hypothetical protein
MKIIVKKREMTQGYFAILILQNKEIIRYKVYVCQFCVIKMCYNNISDEIFITKSQYFK